MAHDQIFHIGVKGLIKNTEGRYLCVKSSEGYFDIPGGRIMAGEDWKFTLFRELREELCVPSDTYSLGEKCIPLPTSRFTQQEPQPIQLFILICPCQLLDDNTPILLNEENVEYSWETARDLYEKVTILHNIPFENIFE